MRFAHYWHALRHASIYVSCLAANPYFQRLTACAIPWLIAGGVAWQRHGNLHWCQALKVWSWQVAQATIFSKLSSGKIRSISHCCARPFLSIGKNKNRSGISLPSKIFAAGIRKWWNLLHAQRNRIPAGFIYPASMGNSFTISLTHHTEYIDLRRKTIPTESVLKMMVKSFWDYMRWTSKSLLTFFIPRIFWQKVFWTTSTVKN